MTEVKIGDTVVQLYSSVEDLPIRRYAKFQKYNLIESGIGADLEAISGHFAKLFEFITFKMGEESLREAKNLYYTFYMMLNEVNVPSMAFACLVHKIGDDPPVVDISEDGLKAICARLAEVGLTQQDVLTQVGASKKKIRSELRRLFPYYFNDDDTVNFYQRVKNKIAFIASIDQIGDTEDPKKDGLITSMAEIDKYFAEFFAPMDFDEDSDGNAINGSENSFEAACAMMETNGVQGAADMSTQQFYGRLEHFKRQAEELKRLLKK